jgi:Kef-type K+ transport system membrane component KefB/nucleotide-binding universal stress UspA family protein
MGALIHDPVTRFIAQIAVIVLVSRVLGVIARRVGQPMVIAEVTAGILLGPSLLGWVAPATYDVLFTADSMRVLHLVAQLGLVLFMFLVGLELDPALLRGRRHATVLISHSSIIAPFLLGVLLAIYLRPRLSEPGTSFTAFALFLGAAMSITAFPVLARILTERRLHKSKVGAITIACAAVDDVTAWCILAFVVATARATGVGAAMRTSAMAVAYVVLMIWVVRPLLARVASRVSGADGLTQNVVAVTILVLLASSWATELIGIHALFGAFMFGAILPKEGGFAHALAEKLEDLVVVVLLPLFFAYSGVRTHLGLLDTWWAWGMCALITANACLGKFGLSTLTARLTGLSWREASALGILMNTRGLMELIVLNIGLDLGVITPTLFTMMVIMALVTTFMTTPLLQLIYPADSLARDLVEEAEPKPVAAPASFTTLVCVAHAGAGPGLVTVARALRPHEGEARTYALHLMPPTQRGSFYIDPPDLGDGQGVLEPLLARAERLALPVTALSFISGDPAGDICRMAEVKQARLILLGSHRPVLSQTFLGGIVYDVMKEAPGDVGVLIDRGLSGLKRVLVPFLGSSQDRAALALARRALENMGAEVTILHVVKPERRVGDASLGARDEAGRVFGENEAGRVVFKVVEHASPIEAAIAESEHGYDLVMVGIGREWGLRERPFAIHPETLMQDCQASVLVVRASES